MKRLHAKAQWACFSFTRPEMASYPWEVVRNSNSGEKSYLKLDGTAKLKVAAWVQLDVAKQMAATAGMNIDKMMADARSRDFPSRNPARKVESAHGEQDSSI